MSARGLTVLVVDYRGYGGNPGSPTEDGLIRDARAGFDHLREQGFTPGRIVIVGESIGTGVAAALAGQTRPGGLLLRSPFTSLGAVARHLARVPVGWLLRDDFDTLSRIGEIGCPISVLAGAIDELVPQEQSRQVADAVSNLQEFFVLDGAGHNDAAWFGPLLAEHVDRLAAVVEAG